VSVKTIAEAVWSDPLHATESLPELAHNSATQWAEEGYRLAIEHAYKNGTLNVVAWKSEFGSDAGSLPTATPVLSAEYKAQARAVARRQAVLAARRTVKIVQECFAAE
jgi:hypothetical protein